MKKVWDKICYIAGPAACLYCVFDKSLSVGGQIFFLLLFVLILCQPLLTTVLQAKTLRYQTITNAYTEISKTIGYNITFKTMLKDETDISKIAEIQKSIAQNDAYIQQQEAHLDSLKIS